jgi:hypothetical protein
MDRKSKKQAKKETTLSGAQGGILNSFTADYFSEIEQDFENVETLLFSNHREYESAIA